MDKRLKHGWAAGLKTRSSVKRGLTASVLLAWLLSTLACSQTYLNSAELTATAAVAPPVAALPSAQPGPTALAPAPTLIAPTPAAPPAGSGLITPAATYTATKPLPTATVTLTPTPGPSPTPKPPLLYYAQAGDTLPALAARFGVAVAEITSPDPIPAQAYIKPNQLLIIPDVLEQTAAQEILIPDSEVVYSPSAVDFDIDDFVAESGGYLSQYREYLAAGWLSGAQVIQRVAIENSINPRLLLALIEYQSHWVTDQPRSLSETDYPLGNIDINRRGLYKQLSWGVEQLSIGYYGWQAGTLTQLDFSDGVHLRLWPHSNAGTAAIAYLFSRVYDSEQWGTVIDSKDQGFTAIHTQLFGNPWLRAKTVEPLFPPDLTQPILELPYRSGESWAYSGGPHAAWGPNGALAAVDFAPPAVTSGCVETEAWATASATGLVVRTGNGIVVLDLDGDGREQTGWVLLYLHIATRGRVTEGTWVTVDDILGHPSCEGGVSTGTHVHMARKYNGQWMLAAGPIPMVLSNWQVQAGAKPYEGHVTRDEKVITACTCGSAESRVLRDLIP